MNRLFALIVFAALTAQAQDDIDYTKQIRQFTTEPRFMTELVDHLPPSATVPTPLAFNGYIAGAEGHLTYAEDVYRYMRALEAATTRVKVLSIGKTEEGREMILVAVSSEANMARLDRYREITRLLSDPRKVSDEQARALIAEGRPMYYATGAMHSPETGSPEMLMELAYRLAVEDTPLVRSIRDNVITLITPVLEVDGRNRMVDLWHYREKNPNVPTPPLIYWGHYVAHDNNRDNLGLALNLSRNVMGAYFDFHPQVLHDLHESVPFLYISTGTGPYNPSLDPLMIDEWHRMAYHEVNELTRRGLPGAWTHGFYDGWAPNYMFWIGMGHNTIGRFYETFGNRWPTTENRIVRAASERTWYRPNPPLPQVRWSLRNNINYQQSALLFALSDMASNREHFLEQFWQLGKRAVAKSQNEGPAAWVFDGRQKRDTSVWAIEYGLARWIDTVPPNKLKSPGTILSATVTDRKSPIAAGYDETIPVYYSGSPIFKVGVRDDTDRETRQSGRGGKNDPDVAQGRPYVPLPEKPKAGPGEEGFLMPEDAPYNFEPFMPRAEDRPRVIVSFAKSADQLLMSGMLEGGDEIAGKPVVVLSPRGRGNILLFANNPMWRANTQGNYALVMNAIMSWDHLR